MKKIYILLCLAAVALSEVEGLAQQTGSFSMTVNFGGNPNWPIAFYVPTNYNAANKYKLIVGLHGLGGTCTGYRNYLEQYVSMDPSMPVYDAIVVAPGNGDGSNTDFWTAPCDTSIITIAMNLALSNYNIDQSKIYLQGISLGGHAALRYGLINWWRFCGIELWCPAVQSVAEANNQDPSFTYPYQNGKNIPISITIGSEDGYIQNGQLDATMNQLLSIGAPAYMQIELGVPHGTPSNSQNIVNNYNFINAQASTYTQNDAAISDIITPFDEECTTTFSPVINIQNRGLNNLTSAIINYQLDGGPVQTYNWSGNLKRLEKNAVTLPTQTVSNGSHTFNAYTTQPNGTADAVSSNDGITKTFSSLGNGVNSLNEGFENAAYPPFGWKNTGTNKVWYWKKVTGLGASGSNSCIMFDNWTFDKTGRRYSLYTGNYDFTNASSAMLTYDYAYCPYQDAQGTYGDTLVVYYSTNCGNTWTQLLYKGGMQISSTGGTTNTWFIPNSSQWKTETINLSSLIGQPKVMLRFEDRPNYSNELYLDNIKLTGITAIAEEQSEESLAVFPNPMSESATVYSEMENCSLKLFDVTGNVVKSFSNVSQFPFTIQRGNLFAGIYFLELRNDAKVDRIKLIIN